MEDGWFANNASTLYFFGMHARKLWQTASGCLDVLSKAGGGPDSRLAARAQQGWWDGNGFLTQVGYARPVRQLSGVSRRPERRTRHHNAREVEAH